MFIAIDVDDETRGQLAEVRAAIVAQLRTAAVPPRVTWVKEEAAHVTVRFLGETTEHAARAISKGLSDGLGLPAFSVKWERLGTFPSGRKPRVIWIGPTSGEAELQAVAAAVNSRLAPIIEPADSRPFAPHLTIGRVKERGKDVDWARAVAAAPFRPTITRVDHVTLYLSKLSSKGPTYTALQQVQL